MSRSHAWMMWFLASIFYAYQYVLRVLPNIMMPDIMAKYHIEAGLFGQYSGLYYIGYAGMHLPIGLMLDRVGPRKVIPVCMLMAVIGLSPLIWTDIWIYPILGRILMGIGSSGAILGVFKIIRICFPTHQFTRMLGISVTIGLLGALYGGTPVFYLLESYGWQQVLMFICLAGILMAAATYFLLPEHKDETSHSSPNIWASVKTVLMQPRAILICILGGLMVGPLEGFADAWGAEYLKTVYGINPETATGLPALIYIGMAFGSPVLSYIADKTKNYYAVTIASALIMALCFILMMTGALNLWSLSVNFFVIGLLCAYQIPVIFMASQSVPSHIASLTTACANMIIMTFGYFFHTSIGKILDLLWDGSILKGGAPVYSSANYNIALMVIPVGLIVGALGFLWLHRRLNKYEYSYNS